MTRSLTILAVIFNTGHYHKGYYLSVYLNSANIKPNGKYRIETMSAGPTEIDNLLALLKPPPIEEYEGTATRLKDARKVFHSIVANQLEPQLQARVLDLPQSAYSDKKALAGWVNGEARSLGLAFKCPKTSLACAVAVDPGSGDHLSGRFRLRPYLDAKRRTCTSTEMFQITLVPYYERIEPFSRSWSSLVVNRPESNQGREN